MALDVKKVQRFATDMLGTNSRKTILNVLGTLFAILDFARKCGSRVPNVKLTDLTIRGDKGEEEAPHLKPEDVAKILALAKEPYRTIFALAWATGLRAGELLGLTVDDVDFQRGVIRPRKQADDSTRTLRHLKAPKSASPIPMTAETAKMLEDYLRDSWKPNPKALLFPNKNDRPRKREYVVKFGLKPLLKQLGLPTAGVGLHAFRHGMGTALANNKVSPKIVQDILRHSDIKTTFRYYIHSDLQDRRNALAVVSIGTNVPIGTENRS